MATRKFVGEGGGTWTIDVPLSETYQYQYDKGMLRLVDGEKPFDEEDAPDAGQRRPARSHSAPPDRAAPKAEWVDYATDSGGLSPEYADSLSKAELVKRFGS